MTKVKEVIRDIFETFLLSIIIIFSIYQFVASMEVVFGTSMEPNFETGQRILVDRVTKYFRPYQRGEIVVLVPKDEGNRHLIKRIVGLPGDIIKIFDCSVFIADDNSKFKLSEQYLAPGTCTVGGPGLEEGRSIKLKENQYIVLGDNRAFSIDSRVFGAVERKDILGRVVFRFWPANKAGFIR